MKKLLLFLILGLFITGVLAIWIVSIKSTATYDIYSQEYGGMNIVKDLSGGSFNSLNQTISNTDEFIFDYNGNEDAEVNILITTIKQDIADNCTNWQNDCNMTYKHIGHSNLNEGDNIRTIPQQQHNIRVSFSCVQYACPQTITPTIEVIKLEK